MSNMRVLPQKPRTGGSGSVNQRTLIRRRGSDGSASVNSNSDGGETNHGVVVIGPGSIGLNLAHYASRQGNTAIVGPNNSKTITGIKERGYVSVYTPPATPNDSTLESLRSPRHAVVGSLQDLYMARERRLRSVPGQAGESDDSSIEEGGSKKQPLLALEQNEMVEQFQGEEQLTPDNTVFITLKKVSGQMSGELAHNISQIIQVGTPVVILANGLHEPLSSKGKALSFYTEFVDILKEGGANVYFASINNITASKLTSETANMDCGEHPGDVRTKIAQGSMSISLSDAKSAGSTIHNNDIQRKRIARLFHKMGVKVENRESDGANYIKYVFKKLARNTTYNPLCYLLEQTIGELEENPPIKKIMRQIIGEVKEIAKEALALEPDELNDLIKEAEIFEIMRTKISSHYPSSVQDRRDAEKLGRPIETEAPCYLHGLTTEERYGVQVPSMVAPVLAASGSSTRVTHEAERATENTPLLNGNGDENSGGDDMNVVKKNIKRGFDAARWALAGICAALKGRCCGVEENEQVNDDHGIEQTNRVVSPAIDRLSGYMKQLEAIIHLQDKIDCHTDERSVSLTQAKIYTVNFLNRIEKGEFFSDDPINTLQLDENLTPNALGKLNRYVP